MDLSGKTALVTGGTSGIGAAIVKGYAAAGAKVAFCGRRTTEGEAVLAEVRAEGGAALFITADVASPEDVQRLVDRSTAELGPLDVALNCAGVGCGDVKLADITPEEFDQLFAVNVRGVFLCLRAELRSMVGHGKGGSIVNMGSILGHVAFAASAKYSAGHYIAAKHAVEGLTKAAAADYGPAGIRVNSIAPGIVATPMSEETRRLGLPLIPHYQGGTALGRLASVDDIVGAAVFLASDASRYITGVSIPVDGGYLAQ
jgi:NAD(P)-dependent dehydrogenase (short-subunit alcohol dehydrogenase family)